MTLAAWLISVWVAIPVLSLMGLLVRATLRMRG
jgi:hypothetical protein